MTLLELLDRPIAFHRPFVTITKSVNAALLLSQSVYWSNRTSSSGGWFYKSSSEWTAETGLTRREMETARRILRDFGLIEESLRGVPATLNFRVNKDVLKRLLSEVPSSFDKSAKLDSPKAPNKNGGIGESNSETTTETTAKTLPESPSAIQESIRKAKFSEFKEGWMRGYEEAFGHSYKFSGAKDGAAIKSLVGSTNPAEAIAIARQAWTHPDWWHCRNAASIAGFSSRLNDIRHELAHPPKGRSVGGNTEPDFGGGF